MPAPSPACTISPLHESALLIQFGNHMDADTHAAVMQLWQALQQAPFAGMQELVPAYSSLAVYYDPLIVRTKNPGTTAFAAVKNITESRITSSGKTHTENQRLIRIPVYYTTSGTDLAEMAATKNMDTTEIIQLHTAVIYDVYMLGFLPGFAYMASVDERIATPRKTAPQPVSAGSVGIAGRQTGIYPLHSPGGWHIIGHTPLLLFDIKKETGPCLLRAGDQVQFYSITAHEFEDYKSRIV